MFSFSKKGGKGEGGPSADVPNHTADSSAPNNLYCAIVVLFFLPQT